MPTVTGVLHRDIKPDNLMFNADGVLKVTDFGIAKVLGPHLSRITAAGMGTPAYMSPEQAVGRELTPAADVYSLGTVLYEMLAGRLPYPEAEPVAMLMQDEQSDPLPVREAAPGLPGPIAEVVDRSLARNPESRYQTASAFEAALCDAASTALGEDWVDGPDPSLRQRRSIDLESVGAKRRGGWRAPPGIRDLVESGDSQGYWLIIPQRNEVGVVNRPLAQARSRAEFNSSMSPSGPNHVALECTGGDAAEVPVTLRCS